MEIIPVQKSFGYEFAREVTGIRKNESEPGWICYVSVNLITTKTGCAVITSGKIFYKNFVYTDRGGRRPDKLYDGPSVWGGF